VLAECRRQADAAFAAGKPVSRTAAAIIVILWLGLAAALVWWGWQSLSKIE